MSEGQQRLNLIVEKLRTLGSDLQEVEVKAGAGGFPRTVLDSVVAFANSGAGTVIIGLSEADGFAAVTIDAATMADQLANACNDDLEPPIRDAITILEVDGKPVVVMEVSELEPGRKPCIVKKRGLERGAFTRGHDGDRPLTMYEVHILMSARGQPVEDTEPVIDASIADLDGARVEALLDRLRRTRGGVFATASDAEVLRLLPDRCSGDQGNRTDLDGDLVLVADPTRSTRSTCSPLVLGSMATP